MTILKNINKYKLDLIRNSNGIHRYGFSKLLAKLCGFNITPKPFADWVHGWLWHDIPDAELLGCSKIKKHKRIIVCNDREKKSLEINNYNNVEVGGLPFAYVEKQNVQRHANSLLIMPAHSAEVEKISKKMDDYFDYMYEVKKDFDQVYVCIHYLDFHQDMHKAAEIRGFKVIEGARPDNGNSLLRMRSIFDSFEYVTSNSIGSHMIYSLYAGCKFSFSGPIYNPDESHYLSGGNPNGHSENFVKLLIYINSEIYLKKRFNRFFFDHPGCGISDLEFASIEVGEDNLLNSEKIIKYLGWDAKGQVKGYFNGGIGRLLKSVA